jgi:hypothetical protein
MIAVKAISQFERIYETDLVYVPDCWQLCSDAHCCSFAKYKKNFNTLFESGFLRQNLLDSEWLRTELSKLARCFKDRYGDRFQLERVYSATTSFTLINDH